MIERLAILISKVNLTKEILYTSMIAPYLKRLREYEKLSEDSKSKFARFYSKHKTIIEESISDINLKNHHSNNGHRR